MIGRRQTEMCRGCVRTTLSDWRRSLVALSLRQPMTVKQRLSSSLADTHMACFSSRDHPRSQSPASKLRLYPTSRIAAIMQTETLVQRPLIQVNIVWTGTKKHNNARGVTVTVTVVAAVPSNPFPLLTTIRSVTSFICKSFMPLSLTFSTLSWAYLFVWLPQPPN